MLSLAVQMLRDVFAVGKSNIVHAENAAQDDVNPRSVYLKLACEGMRLATVNCVRFLLRTTIHARKHGHEGACCKNFELEAMPAVELTCWPLCIFIALVTRVT